MVFVADLIFMRQFRKASAKKRLLASSCPSFRLPHGTARAATGRIIMNFHSTYMRYSLKFTETVRFLSKCENVTHFTYTSSPTYVYVTGICNGDIVFCARFELRPKKYTTL